MPRSLMAWIGYTDLRASQGEETAGLGPIGQVVAARKYAAVHLLTNFSKGRTAGFNRWLSGLQLP